MITTVMGTDIIVQKVPKPMLQADKFDDETSAFNSLKLDLEFGIVYLCLRRVIYLCLRRAIYLYLRRAMHVLA